MKPVIVMQKDWGTAPKRSLSSGSGFTLIELLVTMSVSAILLAVAVPSFQNFVIGQRVKTAASDIAYSLTYARSEAIKRRANVTFTPAAGGWQNGWVVSANTATISTHEGMPNLAIAGPGAGVTYNDNGRVITVAPTFSISSATSGTVSPSCVTVDLNGMSSTKKGAC